MRAQPDPPMSTCSPGSPSPGLHPKKSEQQVEGGDSAPLLCCEGAQLEHCVHLWGPRGKKDLLEKAQRRPERHPEGWSPSAPVTGWENLANQTILRQVYDSSEYIWLLITRKKEISIFVLFFFSSLNATKYHYSQRQPKRKTDQNRVIKLFH